jgi:hypothetical protein
MKEFLHALRVQRWDDHRYYHQSRINQTLHFISALSFLTAYALMFSNPSVAALIGWLVSMVTRQSGHFFFEPLGYDHVNQATNEYKEAVKVGYNLQRKMILISIWALAPMTLFVDPTLFGLFEPATDRSALIDQVGIIWLAVGVGGLLFRTVQLFFIRDVQTGLVWMTKILTDPFHDLMLYYKAPFYLLRGQLIDPMDHAMQHKGA